MNSTTSSIVLAKQKSSDLEYFIKNEKQKARHFRIELLTSTDALMSRCHGWQGMT